MTIQNLFRLLSGWPDRKCLQWQPVSTAKDGGKGINKNSRRHSSQFLYFEPLLLRSRLRRPGIGTYSIKLDSVGVAFLFFTNKNTHEKILPDPDLCDGCNFLFCCKFDAHR